MAGHLVVAGTLVDEDPLAALTHARAARDRASRVAVVREAVGVAAYHAGDYAEAARELRAYRRMSGDAGYRPALADCERALGRPEVALRLVAEALAESPAPDEAVELRLVEAGARQDLGETAAARLLLESALGGRPRPEQLTADDPGQVRLAAAYAELLAEGGEQDLAEAWSDAVAAADPEGALAEERLGVEFLLLGEDEDPTDEDPAVEDPAVAGDAVRAAEDRPDHPGRAAPVGGADFIESVHGPARSVPGEDEDEGLDFAAEVEAEVAELLGEDAAGRRSEDGDGEG